MHEYCSRCHKLFTPRGYNNDGEYDLSFFPSFSIRQVNAPDGVHWLEELEEMHTLCNECQEELVQWLFRDTGLFLCDPEKNTECKKTGCYIHGGPCFCTNNPEYRRK